MSCSTTACTIRPGARRPFPRASISPGETVACGYATGVSADDLGGLGRALAGAFGAAGPHMIHLRIRPGSLDDLGRPTVPPDQIARRFKAFLSS